MRFQELDAVETRMGLLTLRRREDPSTGDDLYEVKLDDAYLMSSRFVRAEVALAELGLAAVPADRGHLDVVVGGLGLGYTARAALADPRVARLTVVEAFPEVIAWHRRALLPEVADLAHDPRVELVEGDFFACTRNGGYRADGGPDRGNEDPSGGHDAILVDIDHSPTNLLDPSHARFYTGVGLAELAARLRPDGVFALWSTEPPDVDFGARLAEVFATHRAEVVEFPAPIGTATNTVYLATP